MSQQEGSASASPGVCPVDHSTRAAWLEAARKNGTSTTPPHPTSPAPSTSTSTTLPPPPPPSQKLQQQTATSPTATCDSTALPPTPLLDYTTLPKTLSSEREVSTIPRTLDSPDSPNPDSHTTHEHTSKSGTWLYPSEQMFFSAMRRKSWDPQASDMQHIVPIHNAVNERAWHEIKKWEHTLYPQSITACGGPKLDKFSGDAAKLTPKARIMMLLGYQKPFDRHDWTVDRCGKKVEYVIDFYSGRRSGGGEAVSFYLDVRPKINSLEGAMMRARMWFNELLHKP
ncbi:cytochrome c1 heme lyase [Peziza echinospora]|nr:cytochrome c1 heme lyase [Peziza echinospora]